MRRLRTAPELGADMLRFRAPLCPDCCDAAKPDRHGRRQKAEVARIVALGPTLAHRLPEGTETATGIVHPLRRLRRAGLRVPHVQRSDASARRDGLQAAQGRDTMADPKFVPPLRFDLFRLIETGTLQPLDLCVYGYLVAHSPNWQPVPLDIAKRLNVSHRTATRALYRLRDAGLMTRGHGSKVPGKAVHPDVIRTGVYTSPLQSAPSEVTHDMSSVTQLRSNEETDRRTPVSAGKSSVTSVGTESRSVSGLLSKASVSTKADLA